MNTSEFEVTGMTCGHCELSVREEVQEIPSVESVEVSHRTGRLTVTNNRPLEQAAIVAAIEEAGYRAVPAA
ncbi:heavy-metal-associated domain-containing protein [Arthrobacter globiformis]|uniref:heavy-metal-associated domain-containing protein n=1 Tax=Arthrobacter globiformis TaxID=1665 RepID=UPI002793CAAC|nr:heavy metal-associated domain-containing protein [Arthrobacter globiformis]MDQ0618145.1 copper chaperone [Arthrobacter globiformis]